ncbi:MAG: hypothetical protein ACFCVD_01450 [Nodosilinea sp.]
MLPFEGYPFRKAVEIRSQVEPNFSLDWLVRTPEQLLAGFLG